MGIVFREMGDETPNMETGDVNFVIQEISLNQALCGFKFVITHLDKRQLCIQSRPGEVIKPEGEGTNPFVKVVPEEGMPSRGNPFVRGNLYVLFRVKFPEDNELSNDVIEALRNVLPEPDMDIEIDENEIDIVALKHASVKEFGRGGADQARGAAYDSDDEDGAKPVTCQQS